MTSIATKAKKGARKPGGRPLGASQQATGSTPAADDKPLELRWDLNELPSSQHRAGLAGLVLMSRYLGRLPARPGAIREEVEVTDAGAAFRINREGMRALFDAVYGSSMGESSERARRKVKDGKEDTLIRVDEIAIIDKKTGEPARDDAGKEVREKRYVYPRVVPRGAFLEELDPSPDGVWIKLWRDMLWQTLRGVPMTRLPFENRAKGQVTDDADETFRALAREPGASVELASTYYLGAQARTADNVPFRDRGRLQFLLHFWPFVAEVYVPRVLKNDGTQDTEGYVYAIPDICDLVTFCEELAPALKNRSGDKRGYLPAEATVDVPVESALALLLRVEETLRASVARKSTGDLVYGVDVVHVEKQGNTIKLLGSGRVEPQLSALDEYGRIKGLYWHSGFRRQRLLNLLAGRTWHQGMGRYVSTTSDDLTIGSPAFRHDTREAFKQENPMSDPSSAPEKSLEQLVYKVVTGYVFGKLKSKYELEWKEASGDAGKEGEYDEKRQKVAKEAFLAVRARTGADFVQYFSSTLFAVPQRLGEDGYLAISRALLADPETVRTLTLLALSARA